MGDIYMVQPPSTLPKRVVGKKYHLIMKSPIIFDMSTTQWFDSMLAPTWRIVSAMNTRSGSNCSGRVSTG